MMIDGRSQAHTQFTSSAVPQEKALKTLQHAVWFIGRFYAAGSVQRLSFTTTIGEIPWARYVHRLVGLPEAVQAVLSSDLGSSSSKRSTYTICTTIVARGMAWSKMACCPLEHVAYLYWKVPSLLLLLSPSFGTRHGYSQQQQQQQQGDRLAALASAWSCRFWLLYVVLDLARSTWALMPNMTTRVDDDDDDDDDDESLSSNSRDLQTRCSEQLQIIRNLLFTLPAYPNGMQILGCPLIYSMCLCGWNRSFVCVKGETCKCQVGNHTSLSDAQRSIRTMLAIT
jgi:hypothetical protein